MTPSDQESAWFTVGKAVGRGIRTMVFYFLMVVTFFFLMGVYTSTLKLGFEKCKETWDIEGGGVMGDLFCPEKDKPKEKK